MLYEFAEVTGKVAAVQASDFRQMNRAVDEFVARLRTRPGVEVIQVKLPFDTGAQSSLSGDIGADAGRIPQFSVSVARKLGS